MRSYEAARGYFSFLSFLAWAGILGGLLLAFVAGRAALETNLPPVGAFLAAAPGISLVVIGFFGLIFVQSSRASVDCAEYAQQSLQLSRDQFEVSKQLLQLAQTKDKGAGYEAAATEDTLQNISFDTEEPAEVAATIPPLEVIEPVKVEPPKVHSIEAREHEYAGAHIVETDGQFLIEPKPYATLQEAQKAVDRIQSHRPMGAFKLRT